VFKNFDPTLGDGTNPDGGLTLLGGELYGTTFAGGDLNEGTVYRQDLLLPIPLTIHLAGGNLAVLSWREPGFVLQAAPTVTGTYTNVPGAVSPYTNTITASEEFFRMHAQ
jgi:uncharacterized repeat protein (TIGR03803 family)